MPRIRESRKTRFMPDRRAAYTDFSLSLDTGWFVAGYSNPVFAAHGIAFGDANGRVGWTRDLPAAVNRVGISADGRVLAAALQSATAELSPEEAAAVATFLERATEALQAHLTELESETPRTTTPR